ncbi:hypothetical protein V2A60_000366 [Cordyceps javanica]
MDELVPILGAGVIFIYASFQEKHCYLDELRREIHDIPGLAKFVAKRIKAIDVSEMSEHIAVHFSLAVVGWAIDKSFSKICDSFGFYNLRHLVLNYDKFNHAAAKFVAIKQDLAKQNQKVASFELEIAGLELDRSFYLSFRELQINIVHGQQRDYASRSSEVTDSRCESEAADDQERATASPDLSSVESPMATPRTSADSEAGLGGLDPGRNGREDQVSEYDLAGQSAGAIEETPIVAPNEEPLVRPFQPSVDSGYASNAATQQVCGTPSVTSSSGATLSEIGGGGESFRASGQKRPQSVDSATSKRQRSGTAETMEDLVTAVEPSQGDVAANTNASTDPSQDEFLEELAGIEDFAEFPVGSGMTDEDFWAGSGMDLNDVNLATPTGVPGFLGAEQPCESSLPAAGSKNEHQAE